jgi:2-keto-4-pentenoate hydratase/2-oxohepta-3-ene-1,7-dioic acid hydratase in catechol pathway
MRSRVSDTLFFWVAGAFLFKYRMLQGPVPRLGVASALRLANYIGNGATRMAIVHNGLVFDIAEAAKELGIAHLRDVVSIDQILTAGLLDALHDARSSITRRFGGLPVESVKLRSPILAPEKILLVARNYLSHNIEQNAKPPSEPYFFTKFRNALIGPDDPVVVPMISKKVDWEAELAVILGKAGKNIARKDAMEYVAGYTVANDISFRDLQFSTRSDNAAATLGSNWVKGKNLDSSFPLGPWLVTKDEVPDPNNLEISLTVNGKTRQHANTSDMVFKVDTLIEYASAGMTLKPGDIISTGTPEGVAAFSNGPFLKDGDAVEAQIDRIGVLRNRVRSEES